MNKTYGRNLGRGWTPSTISDIFYSNLPGDFVRAGKTYGGTDWGMDRGPARFFSSQKGSEASFQDFLNLQRNPDTYVQDAIKKGSPAFLISQAKFGIGK